MCYAVNKVKQAIVRSTKLFWKVVNHVLRYLKGTTHFGLWYRWTEVLKMCGFTDVDWVVIPSEKKSTSSGIFSVWSTTVSWYNRIKYLWCSAQQKTNTWMQFKQHARRSRWEIYLWDYLVRWWIQLWSTVIIRVSSSSLKILYFTIDPSI